MTSLINRFFLSLIKNNVKVDYHNLYEILPSCLEDVMWDETRPVSEWSDFGQYCAKHTYRTESEMDAIDEVLWQYASMYSHLDPKSPWEKFADTIYVSVNDRF